MCLKYIFDLYFLSVYLMNLVVWFNKVVCNKRNIIIWMSILISVYLENSNKKDRMYLLIDLFYFIDLKKRMVYKI